MKLKLLLTFFLISSLINAQIYVNKDATGLENGTSWANAYTDLNDAISDNSGTDIWLAKGSYIPGSVRTSSFNISNKKIYGGFVGTETMLSDRDFRVNKSIISGDLLDDDNNSSLSFTDETIDDNVFHVITITGPNVVLDGVTVSGGNANGTGAETNGAAIYSDNTASTGVTLKNVIIENNVATNLGVINITPKRNTTGNTSFTSTIFRNNLAKTATIYYVSMLDSNKKMDSFFENCLIYNNYVKDVSSNNKGGNVLIWSRTERAGSVQNITINNTTITDNKLNGTGQSAQNPLICVNRFNGSSHLKLNNNIFWNNTRRGNSAVTTLGKFASNQILANSMIARNNINRIQFSNIEDQAITISSDPLFTDASNNNYTLTDASIAIGLGDNSKISSDNTTDLNGNPRINLTNVDVGAYENQTATSEPFINFTDANLKTYLLSLTNLDTNGDGEIQFGEAGVFVGDIILNNIGVENLTGLEFFPKITKFTSVGNALSTDINLSIHKQLTEIIIRNSLVETILLPETSSVTKLDFRNNKLKELNISKLTKVVDFNVRNNQLTNLNLQNGNNSNFTDYDSRDNPDLTCILVDDKVYSDTNWIFKDAASSFNTFCAGIIYVDASATGSNDGSSWVNAYTDLRIALQQKPQETFWVAAGTYKTSTRTNGRTFQLSNSQEIYGGFNGTETKISERDIQQNKTILSGDTQGDDNGAFDFNLTLKDNVRVLISTDGNDIVIDGFTIKSSYSFGNGGALRIGAKTQSLAVRNSIFEDHRAEGAGIIFSEAKSNTATQDYDYIFENCTFRRNIATNATIMYALNPELNGSFTYNVKFINNLFFNNRTRNAGNNVGVNSLFWFRSDLSIIQKIEFINNTIANNSFLGTSNTLAGIISITRVNSNSAKSNPTLKVHNTIFWDNKLSNGNEQVPINGLNNLLVSNDVTVTNSIHPLDFVKATLAADNITTDPQFLAASNGDFRLSAGSSAIDSGDNSFLPPMLTEDLTGNPRIFNTTVDMGAIEYNPTLSRNDEVFTENTIKLYPNPSKTILNIDSKVEINKGTIYNLLGSEVLKVSTKNIDVSQLKSGMYLIRITTEKGKTITKKFMKR